MGWYAQCTGGVFCIHVSGGMKGRVGVRTFFLNRRTRFICAVTLRGGLVAAGGVVGVLVVVVGEVVVEGRL